MEYCTGINLPLLTMSPFGVIASDLVILNSPLSNPQHLIQPAQ